jgi:hypothetical protein
MPIDLRPYEKKYGLPTGLLNAVMMQESGGNPKAVSPKGAQGLFQFMPATAKDLGVDPYDPESSADGAARYLKQHLDKFGSLDLALAAYNAGPGNVEKYKGIPPFEETQKYVPSILEKMAASSEDVSPPQDDQKPTKPKFTKEQIKAELERRKASSEKSAEKPKFTKEQIQAELDKRRNSNGDQTNEDKGYLERVSDDFKKRYDRTQKSKEGYFAGKYNVLKPAADIVADTAGLAGDVVGEGVVSVAKGIGGAMNAVYPDATKEIMEGVGSLVDGPLPVLKPVIGAAKAAQGAYGKFEEEHPVLGSLARATVNVGMLASPFIKAKPAASGVLSQLPNEAQASKQLASGTAKAGALSQKPDKAIAKVVEKLRKDFPDPAEFQKALQSYADESGLSLAEIGGSNTTTLARGAAQFPSGEVATETFLKEKLSTVPTRIKTAASQYIHSDKDFYGTVDDVLKTGRKKAAPLYEEAYKANKSIVSKEIDNILETPAGRKALKDTARVMQNDRALMGLPDKELKAIQRDLTAIGKMDDVSGPIASGLNLRTLDAVKKNLDDQIGKLYRAGDKYEGGVLNDLKNDLVNALDKADVTAKAGPKSSKIEGGAYARARAESGDYIRVSKAIEDGRDFMKHDADLLKRHMEKLSPAERDAFKIGVVRRVRDARINEILDVSDFKVSGKLDNNQEMMGRLKAILPEKEFSAFQTAMKKEEKLIKFRNKVIGGSPTTPKALAAAELASAGAEITDIFVQQGVQAVGRKALAKFVSKTFKGLSDDLSGKVAGVLYETDPAKKLEILRNIQQQSGGKEAVRAYFGITDKVRELGQSAPTAAPAAAAAANTARD